MRHCRERSVRTRGVRLWTLRGRRRGADRGRLMCSKNAKECTCHENVCIPWTCGAEGGTRTPVVLSEPALQAGAFAAMQPLHVVRSGRLELPRPFGHRHLGPARLPVPPRARGAKRGTRTLTSRRTLDSESSASTSSTILAWTCCLGVHAGTRTQTRRALLREPRLPVSATCTWSEVRTRQRGART